MRKNNQQRVKNPKSQVSAIKGLKPERVINTITGELVPEQDWQADIIALVDEVKQAAGETWRECRADIIAFYENPAMKHSGSPTGVAHTHKEVFRITGLTGRKEVLAKSRIKELTEHKVVSETKAWFENPNPKKGELSFSRKINLGAVNNQMCSIVYDTDNRSLILHWKCWLHEYSFFFSVPEYVLNYNIEKFCKPDVIVNEDGIIDFLWSVKEALSYKADAKTPDRKLIIGGYDLGRVEPFVLTVMTDDQHVIAVRKSSKRLRALNNKRESLLKNKKFVNEKIAKLTALGGFEKKIRVLEVERARLGACASRLGVEVAHLMGAELSVLSTHHGIDILAGEDLSWVSDKKGSSRWVHGECQDSIVHAGHRAGVKQDVVSAAFTSTTCPVCGARGMKENSSDRTVSCCKCAGENEPARVFDRDVVGSFNVAARAAKRALKFRLKRLLDIRGNDGVSAVRGPVLLAGGTGVSVGVRDSSGSQLTQPSGSPKLIMNDQTLSNVRHTKLTQNNENQT